jgi:hypothetical protein
MAYTRSRQIEKRRKPKGETIMTKPKTKSITAREREIVAEDKTIAVKKDHDLYTDEEWIEAFQFCGGIVTWIANYLQISIQGVRQKLDRNPHLKEAQIEARESAKDDCEKSILKLAKAGNLDAAKFFLSRMARERGWSDDVNINMNVRSMNMNLDLLGVEDLNDLRRKLASTIIQPED